MPSRRGEEIVRKEKIRRGEIEVPDADVVDRPSRRIHREWIERHSVDTCGRHTAVSDIERPNDRSRREDIRVTHDVCRRAPREQGGIGVTGHQDKDRSKQAGREEPGCFHKFIFRNGSFAVN